MTRSNGLNWQAVASFGSLILSIVVLLISIGIWFGNFNSSLNSLADKAVQKAMDSLLGPGTIIPKFDLGQSDTPDGWVVCSKENTPDFRGRFLIGTTDISEAGKPIGNLHQRLSTTGGESFGKLMREKDAKRDYADNISIKVEALENVQRNWYHEHTLPSVQVVFLCRVLESKLSQ